MERAPLVEVMADQRADFLSAKTLVARDVTLDPYLATRQIVVISGIRRCGKSSLLYLIRRQLGRDDRDILYFNFDDERLGAFRPEDFNTLYALHLEEHGATPRRMVCLFDEIQNVGRWEQFLARLQGKGIKVFVAGSNARLLSSEIATALTGRNKVLELFPFSFAEFLRSRNHAVDTPARSTEQKAHMVRLFREYLADGGFPAVVLDRDPALLSAYYRDILYRDIVTRHALKQVEELKTLAACLASSPASLFSCRKLQAACGLNSVSTLKAYLDCLSHSFLFHYVRRFDHSFKRQRVHPQKSYLADTGFYGRIGFRPTPGRGALLENAVYLHLRRQSADVFYHADGKVECDFVVREGTRIVQAVQVALDMAHPATRARELAGLAHALRHHRHATGLIVTETEQAACTIEGRPVRIVPAWRWLLEERHAE